MQPQEALSVSELLLNAAPTVKIVMLFLLALSVYSWTVIISKHYQFRTDKSKADEFEEKFWSGIDLNNLYQECMKHPEKLVGLEVIYSAGFKEFVRLVNSGPADQDVVMDGTYRQMKVACSRELELLESRLPSLATVGSVSPYIGLFGTVWGIMHAFVALAAVKNATLAMVAPPIAEALIATAMGLFAAIPAVMFYNRFSNRLESLENRYYNFIDEFSTILNRRLVSIRSQMQKGPEAADRRGGRVQETQGMQPVQSVQPMQNMQGVPQSGQPFDEREVYERQRMQEDMSQAAAQNAARLAKNQARVSPSGAGVQQNAQVKPRLMQGQRNVNVQNMQRAPQANAYANNAPAGNYNMAYRGVVPPQNSAADPSEVVLPAQAAKGPVRGEGDAFRPQQEFQDIRRQQ